MHFYASLCAATVVAGVLSTVGCSQFTSPTAPTAAPFGQPSSAASASSSTTILTIPASFTIQPGAKAAIQACVGETVTFVGNSQVVAHLTTLPDGSTSLDLLHFNGKGAIAVGGSTGATYHLVGADSNPIVFSPSSGLTATFDANLLVIGPGSARSFMAHILEHITFTPAGDVSALLEFVSIECR